MHIFNNLNEFNIEDKTSVALGNFDGIHIGHRKIMEDALKSAKSCGYKSLCFTFSNHPFNFIMQRDDSDPNALKLICSEDEKIKLIEEMGFDILVNIPFDEEIMSMKAEHFFDGIIKDKLNAGFVSIGFNYSYGARAGGNPSTLREECEASDIGINVHEAVKEGGKVVSSTLIREMIKIGNMEMAAKYLGRNYSFSGIVNHGKHIGSGEGYPTANLSIDSCRMLPPCGVYFSEILIDGCLYKGVSNLGIRPTITGNDLEVENIPELKLESFIFNFDGDIYGKEIIVMLNHFSRGEKKFDSKTGLYEQISRDCTKAMNYHGVL